MVQSVDTDRAWLITWLNSLSHYWLAWKVRLMTEIIFCVCSSYCRIARPGFGILTFKPSREMPVLWKSSRLARSHDTQRICTRTSRCCSCTHTAVTVFLCLGLYNLFVRHTRELRKLSVYCHASVYPLNTCCKSSIVMIACVFLNEEIRFPS